MSERNGDYCQKCGAPVEPTDEKCPNGHVLAEVGRSFERSASAGIEIKATAKSRKSNDFEKIIDECGTDTEEDDLLKLLDMKIDFVSKMYIITLGFFIQGAVLFRNFELPTTSFTRLNNFIFGLYVAAIIIFVYQIIRFMENKPFQTQRNILQDYINARMRLKELKNERKTS